MHLKLMHKATDWRSARSMSPCQAHLMAAVLPWPPTGKSWSAAAGRHQENHEHWQEKLSPYFHAAGYCVAMGTEDWVGVGTFNLDEGVQSVNPMRACRSKKMHAKHQHLLPRFTLLNQEAICTGIGAAAAHL